jgi:hypothetical protein
MLCSVVHVSAVTFPTSGRLLSVLLCLVYTWAALPNLDIYYTNILCIVSDIARIMTPYLIIGCSGNLTELPMSIFFGLVNTHKFVISYPDVCSYAVESQHNFAYMY